MEVGVFDVRETPISTMSAWCRSSAPRPSSCFTANSIAAMRRKYWASSGALRPGTSDASRPDAVVIAFSAGPSCSRVCTRACRIISTSVSTNWLWAARPTRAAVSPVESDTMWISSRSDTSPDPIPEPRAGLGYCGMEHDRVTLVRTDELTDAAPYAYAALPPAGARLVVTAGACPLDEEGTPSTLLGVAVLGYPTSWSRSRRWPRYPGSRPK